METIAPFIAAALTLMVFSYILGDNILFKLASHIFVGVSVGYAMLILWHEVFAHLLQPSENQLLRVLPALLLCLLLIFKIRPSQGEVTNVLGAIPMAFVLGVGAALAIGGALFGTLIPQVSATMNISLNPTHYPDTEQEIGIVNWLNNFIIFIGTTGTFFYFMFVVRSQGMFSGVREGFIRFWAGMGRLIIIFTLAALFANTISARVAVLVSRLQFLGSFFK
jgi:hypothetical protein